MNITTVCQYVRVIFNLSNFLSKKNLKKIVNFHVQIHIACLIVYGYIIL